MKHNRRTETRKPDRLTNPNATHAETVTHYALGPFDAACRAMDVKWGQDRLPQLVSPKLAAIWGQTMANLNAAITASHGATDPARAQADVVACVESCLRGFKAMDAEAEANGAPKSDPQLYEITANGQTVFIIKDPDHWPALRDKNRDMVFYFPSEIINALNAYSMTGEIVTETKKHFPGAHVSKITNKDPVDWDAGDAINF